MKKIICTVLSLALGLVILAGCAPSSDTGSGEAGTRRNEVIIAFPEIPAHFDPLDGFGGGGHGNGQRLIFSTLVELNADLNIVPDLAHSYTVSEDALTYTFELRTDARFSDGSLVTADDVVFSFQTLMGNVTGIDLTLVESVSASGDTVTIRLSRPQSTFILTVAEVGIVPQKAYNADFGLNPIGSGPFRLTQFDVDQQFILEVNEYYYGPVPGIERAIFVRIPDEDARLAAVRGGLVDIALTSAPLAAALGEIPGFRLLVAETVDNMGIVMPTVPDLGEVNQFGFPVGSNVSYDVNFRRAIAYGIAREALVRDAFLGFATPAYSENDGLPWSNPESRIETDIDYAIFLLENSGWLMGDDGIRQKDGLRASMPLMYSAGVAARQALAMALAQQAREKLGIELIV